MGQRTDVKSPAILLPFAVCYESPWSLSVPKRIFMGSINVWPEACTDGWAHVRAAGRPGLRLLLAPVFSASLVTLLLFPHFYPPSPSPSPPKLDFYNKCVSSFSSCSTGSSNTPLLYMSIHIVNATHEW